MNTQPIESGFAQMGARVKVREIPSRWTRGDRLWIDPQDYFLDIQRDNKGEFFELRVPTHLEMDPVASHKGMNFTKATHFPDGNGGLMFQWV